VTEMADFEAADDAYLLEACKQLECAEPESAPSGVQGMAGGGTAGRQLLARAPGGVQHEAYQGRPGVCAAEVGQDTGQQKSPDEDNDSDDNYENYDWSQEGPDEHQESDEVDDSTEEDTEPRPGRVIIANMDKTPGQFIESRVPQKTRKSTENSVKMFSSWTAEFNYEFGTEWPEDVDDVPDDELPDTLAAWLQGLARPTGELYNASSLVTFANSMARHLKHTRKLDIRKDPAYYNFQQVLKARQQDSAAAAKLPGVNASKPISREDLEVAWRAGALGTGSPKAAAATMVLNMIGMCGFRSCAEVYNLQNGDFKPSLASVAGVPNFIDVDERISKMRRGHKGGSRVLKAKLFADHKNPARLIFII
jgi:hypothetical protein